MFMVNVPGVSSPGIRVSFWCNFHSLKLRFRLERRPEGADRMLIYLYDIMHVQPFQMPVGCVNPCSVPHQLFLCKPVFHFISLCRKETGSESFCDSFQLPSRNLVSSILFKCSQVQYVEFEGSRISNIYMLQPFGNRIYA